MKISKEKQLKRTNGITLIALVITIIVLLILAGISLSMVLNQDGIFSRAEQATEKYGQAKAREKLEVCLSDAQMKKYESGLTETELDNKISEVGSLIPKEDENSKYQLVIVDGHIFEIDRSVPKIVDYKGPAKGVIVTARIIQNGDWQNPVATVTGTITKYGGGSVVSTTATATNGITIPADFPTTGGSYTISNITTDTEITITTTDSDGKIATKTIPVKLVRDNTPPVINGQRATAQLMKITIGARATDSESGLKSLTYKIEPNTIKDGKAEGTLNENGTPIEVEATAVGNYTVTFTATDNSNNTSTATAGPVQVKDTISVEEAKRLVTSMEALQEYVGTKVDYKDGETWQIFYYDQAGEFGSTNTLYLKKEYDDNNKMDLELFPESNKISKKDSAVVMMLRMNPQWKNSSYSEIDTTGEKTAVWLCDPEVWNAERNSIYSSYAIGSPSIEMYMKAYNVWKTGNKDANNLVCKIEDKYGYSVGANGIYNNSKSTGENTIEEGPNHVFMTIGAHNMWCLASPFTGTIRMAYVSGSGWLGYPGNSEVGFCTVVPLDL